MLLITKCSQRTNQLDTPRQKLTAKKQKEGKPNQDRSHQQKLEEEIKQKNKKKGMGKALLCRVLQKTRSAGERGQAGPRRCWPVVVRAGLPSLPACQCLLGLSARLGAIPLTHSSLLSSLSFLNVRRRVLQEHELRR